MTDIFEGQLMSQIECLSCKHKATAFDNFMDLSVEIPKKAIKITGTITL